MNYYEQRIHELEREVQEARAAAATAEQRLATLANLLPEGILLYNDEGTILLINEQLNELLGLEAPARQWLGKSTADMVPIVRAALYDAAAFDALVQETLVAGAGSVSAELLVRNGRTVQLDYVPVSANAQTVYNSRLMCFRDVTERKINARQLHEQRDFYETILDFLPGEAAAYDVNHRYRYVNAKSIADPAVRIWLIGKTDAEYVAYRNRSPELAVQRQARLNEALEKGQVVWEESFRLPDGSMKYVMRHLHTIRGTDEQPRMLIGYGTDITQRYKADERIRALFDALPDTILVVDAAGHIQNGKLGDTGLLLPEAELIGAPLTQVLPEAVQQQLLPCLKQVRATSQPGACTFELPAEGTAVSFHAARVVPLPEAQAVLVILQNVTSQELIRRELAENQAFIRQVVDASPMFIHVRNEASEVVFSNKAFDNLVQLNQHMSIIQGLETADEGSAVEREVARIHNIHKHVLDTREDINYEAAFTLRSGEVRWLQSMKRPFVRSDNSLNVLSLSTDITEIKRARQELESSEKKYRDLVQYSQGLICTHDLHGKMLSVNPATERLLGRSANQLIGRSLHEVVPAEHQAGLQNYLAGFAQRTEQRNVMSIVTRQGSKHYLQYNSYQVQEKDQSSYVVVSAYDITESVLNERVLRQAKYEVEESARAKDNFLASMSHEIRTPLNGVLSMAALLAKTRLDEPQQELVDTINHSGQHLLAVVNDVLDMAKITAGQLQLDHSAFDLWASVQGAVQTMAYLAEEKNIYLSIAPLQSAAPIVLGDSRRLNQVLLNLLNNAIKFTEQGSVTLGGDVLEDTPAAVTIRFWVRDTGIGIPEDKQQRIFGIFAQASADTTRQYGGSGLGLSISQHLVQLMGGALTVDSVVDQGSTFSFTLTLPHTAASQVQPPEKKEWPELAGLRILLADDNRINQRICVLMLESQGVLLDCASNGPEALVLFNEQLYDVVLMDIQMPGMSGVEVTEHIRNHPEPRRAHTPVIALTANARRQDQESYLAAGMNACLVKPFEERHLHQTIVNILSGTAPPTVVEPTPVPSSDELYDLSFLQASAKGDVQFVKRMLQVFLQETPGLVTALDQAASAADWGTVRQVAHSMKPAVTMMRIAGGMGAIETLKNQQAKVSATREAAFVLSQQLKLACAAMSQQLGA